MDLRQIECFLCLYREGSVTRAAAQLGIVQSALSTQIGKLEKSLKIRLFDRSSRGVTPTVAGEDLYKMLLPLSSEVENVRQRMYDLGGQPSGLVRVGTVPSLGVNVVPRALSSYCAQYPDVTIQLIEAYSADLIERVETGSLDLALTNDLKQLGSLVALPLISEELVLVIGSDSPFMVSGAIDLASIPPECLIVPTSGQGLRIIIDRSLGRHKQAVKPHLELDALTPTIEMVKTGAWATILPVSAISRELEQKTIRISRITTPIKRDLIAVYHPRRPLSLAAQNLCKALEQETKRSVDLADQILKSMPLPAP